MFGDSTGLGDEARQMVLGLDKLGVPMRLIPSTLTSHQNPAKLSPVEQDRLDRLKFWPPSRGGPPRPDNYTDRDPERPLIAIHHILPPMLRGHQLYDGLPPVEYQIGRFIFETDRLPEDWVTIMNSLDEVWVSTQFNANTFADAGVDPNKIVVVHQSVDTGHFHPEAPPLTIPGACSFNFLSVFEITGRKGWDVLIRAFLLEFGDSEDVCLVMKISSAYGMSHEYMRDTIRHYIQETQLALDIPNHVILMFDTLPAEEMNSLYAAADAFVLPSRGEGWGRPYMEAMLMELPVIATNWSGQTEFLNKDRGYLVDYTLQRTELTEDRIPFYHGHLWAEPSAEHLSDVMRHVVTHKDEAKAKAQKARKHVLKHFARARVAKDVVKRLTAIRDQLVRAARGGARKVPRKEL